VDNDTLLVVIVCLIVVLFAFRDNDA